MADINYLQYENKNICAACGGYCCKSCGCNYFVSDIKPFTSETIEGLLDRGDVSISTMPTLVQKQDGNIYRIFLLCLRARNKNRSDIDLFSLSTVCASLGPNGCKHSVEERPSGGLLYIPGVPFPYNCRPAFDVEAEYSKWQLHQKMLAMIVQKRTGKTFAEKFSEDVENFFYDMYGEHYDDVLPDILEYNLRLLDQLGEQYPNEKLRALERLAQEYNARTRKAGSGQNVR